MRYQVWLVFRDKGLFQDYYVVNMKSRKVQSAWKNRLEAQATCDKLNKASAKKAV